MFEELWRDDRAIEGLPIRLVIALVVGVASLSVMMNTLGGLQAMTVTEVDVAPSPEVIEAGRTDVELTVVDPEGAAVAGATLVVEGGTATLPEVVTAQTGTDGRATVTLEPSLGPNQADGTVEVSVKPPAGSSYADRRANTDVLVVAD